jgi:hypothetical protein
MIPTDEHRSTRRHSSHIGTLFTTNPTRTSLESNQTKQAIYVYRNTEARWRNHCCRGQAISVAYSACMSVALVIQHEKRMRPIIMSSVACLTLPYLSTLSYYRHDFRKKITEHKVCVFQFSLQVLSETFLVGSIIQRYIFVNDHKVSCKVRVILVGF